MDRRSRETPQRRAHSSAAGQTLQVLLWLAFAAAAVGLVGYHVLVTRFDESIRAHVERQLQHCFPDLHVSVRAARRLEQRGIELLSVHFALPEAREGEADLLDIEQVLITCPTEVAALLAGTPRIDGLQIRGARLRIARESDGRWTLLRLIQQRRPELCIPRIALEDASLELLDARPEGTDRLVLRDIRGVILPPAPVPGATRLEWHGSLRGEFLERMQWAGWYDLSDHTYSVSGSVEKLEWGPRLLRQLPAELAARTAALACLRGRADAHFRVDSPDDTHPGVRYEVRGRCYDGLVEHPQLPVSLRDVQVRFRASEQGVELEQMSARSGETALAMAGFLALPDSPRQTQLRARCTRLTLDRRWRDALPSDLQSLWDKFSPAGLINADLFIDGPQGHWRPRAIVECLDVAFRYDKFPYQFLRGAGVIDLSPQRVSMRNFHAQANARPVRIDAEFQRPGPDSVGWIEFQTEEPVPLDDNLIAALNPRTQGLVRSLQPGGSVGLWGRIERNAATLPYRKTLNISLHKCWLTYSRFPYPLHQIEGSIKVSDDYWLFDRIVGYNDTACVEAKGRWVPRADGTGQLTLEMAAWDLPLEDELRNALKPEAQRIWRALHPRGTIDYLTILTAYDSARQSLELDIQGEKNVPPENNVEGRSIRIEPDWFPYSLDNLVGTFRYRNGLVELRKLQAQHQETQLQTDLRCRFSPDGEWQVQFLDFRADRVHVDYELVSALPPPLREPLGRLNLRGPLSIDGPRTTAEVPPLVTLELQGAPSRPLFARWDLALDLENGSLDVGVPLTHVHGAVHLRGQLDRQQLISQGELSVDSVKYRDVQVTNLQGPIEIHNHLVSLGSWVSRQAASPPPRQITGHALGGALAGDAQISLRDERPFRVEGTLFNGDLAQASRDVAAQNRDVSGRIFGSMRLTGNSRGPHTLRGDGSLRLTDADIYELPVMVRMLKLLSVKPPDRAAFTSSDIRFRLEADHIYFDEFNVNGDVISLKEGQGEMDFQRNVNLKFYTMVGADDFQIPILKHALREASPRILVVHVTGSIDDPEVYRELFPEVNEGLLHLFPESTARNDR